MFRRTLLLVAVLAGDLVDDLADRAYGVGVDPVRVIGLLDRNALQRRGDEAFGSDEDFRRVLVPARRTGRSLLVILGERVSDGTFDHVGIDDVAASRQATEHLLDLGRSRVAAIGDQPYETGEAAQLRTRGFREAHERRRLAVHEELIIRTPRFNRPDGAGAMAHLLDLDDPFPRTDAPVV